MGGFQGDLGNFSASELGGKAIQGAMEKAEITRVDEVIMGNVLGAGQGQAPARQASFAAGLDETVPATTLNKMCGSGMKAAMIGFDQIKLGQSQTLAVGGMESMSNAPQLLMGQRKGKKMGDSKLVDSMIHDGLWDVYNNMHMGNTGEVVARECSIDRGQADAFSVQSHLKAAKAWEEGWFDWETFAVNVPQRRGDDILFAQDEGIKSDSNVETLAKLKPVFNKSGQVTAGNASTLNDGASAILLADESTAKENGWEIMAYVDDYCTSGVEPHRVMSAPIPAIKTLLERNSLDVLDVDIYEHNEAFASASCAVAKEVGIPHDRLNLHGGAISLGHPLGSSGTRCLMTMLGVMRRTEAKSGIVTLCLGGGNAVAMLVSMD